MPSYEQVKRALKHSREFRKLIPDTATLQAAMVHVDLRVKLFDHLLKHPKTLRKLVKDHKDFDALFQMDRNYLQTPECDDVTYQGFLFEKLIKDSALLDRVIKDSSDLNYIAYLLRFAPISEERKATFRLQIIQKLVAIKDKFINVFHSYGGYSDTCLASARHEWPEAIALLSKMETEQVFPIYFGEFRNQNFEFYKSFIGTVEDMRIRWKTFNQTTYEFCITQLQDILNSPTMKEPLYRHYLIECLGECEIGRPKNMESLLSPEIRRILKEDPLFELNRIPPQTKDVSLLVASQQKSGLLQSAVTPETTAVSIARESSPRPTGTPVDVKPN